MKKRFVIMIILIGVLVGCNPENNQDQSITADSGMALPPTWTPLPSSTPWPSPTRYMTATPLPPTPTLFPTLTPPLALEEREAKRVLFEYLETNGNCLLPCYWGIIPGKTTWEEAHQVLGTFADSIYWKYFPEDSLQQGKTIEHYFVSYEVPSYIQSDGLLQQEFVIKNGIVEIIKADAQLELPEFLRKYGKPEVMCVRAVPPGAVEGGGGGPFVIGLYYESQEIFVSFIDKKTTYSGNILRATIPDEEYISLWSPETQASFCLYEGVDKEYPTLEEAIGMDLDTFYERYKNAKGPLYFETPIDIWPASINYLSTGPR